MQLVKRKKGFTLIELMAVIAIIAILAVVLVPTVNGYINRSKKTAVITQARSVVNAIEAHNATATTPISDTSTDVVTTVPTLVGTDLLTESNIDKIQTMTIKDAFLINKDQEAIRKITVNGNNYVSYAP